MKRFIGIATALCLTSSASAFEFTGANTNLRWGTDIPSEFSAWQFNVSAEFEVFDNATLQLGYVNFGFDFDDLYRYAFDVHAGYRLSADTNIGAFYKSENWNGTADGYGFGLEINRKLSGGISASPIHLEAFASRQEWAGYPHYFMGLDIRTDVSNEITLGLGAVLETRRSQIVSDLDASAITASARYNLERNIYFETTLSKNARQLGANPTERDYSIDLVFGIDFGDGVTFGQRNYIHEFPVF